MSTIIPLPATVGTYQMCRLLDGAIKDGSPSDRTIVFDFERVRFMAPLGVVVLANLIEWLRNHGANVEYQNANAANAAVSYLDDVGFFEHYWEAPISPFAQLRQTTFSFRALQCVDSNQWIDGQFFPWLKAKLNCRDAALYRMKTAIREIFNNIADHSEENVGCMHVQWFPNIDQVKIAISDFGIGMPAEVRKVMPDLTDTQALQWASKEGNSSKGGKNKGAGLTYLIENVAKYHKGWLGLYSGKAGLTFNQVNLEGNPVPLWTVYPGTLINMILRTGILPDEDEEEEEVLEW